MKRLFSLVFILGLMLSLCACGKTQAAKDAEAAITAIGEVSTDSGDAIAKAEKLYGILTDSEKESINNRLTLVEAREAYEKLQGAAIYDNAKAAYEKIKETENLCIKGMDWVYDAWYYGIYKADDYAYSFDTMFTAKLSGATREEVIKAREELGLDESDASLMWEFSVKTALRMLKNRGTFDKCKSNMEEASKILQELTEEYKDYTYYPKLKEYYASVDAYVKFFVSPTGSFEQLKDTINSYENGIRTVSSDVGFLFK